MELLDSVVNKEYDNSNVVKRLNIGPGNVMWSTLTVNYTQ